MCVCMYLFLSARGSWQRIRVQWNHCLRTYCNKNFSGWIAGFNPFCRLIETRTLGIPRVPWNSSHWFLFPFNGYQYTKHWLLAAISQKKEYVPRNFHAEDKHGAAPGRFNPSRSHQGWSLQLQLDTSQTHCRSSDLGGGPWLVLACLACAALFRARKPCKNSSGPKKCFSSPRLLCNLIPRQNKLSSPGMVEYLAYSSVWNAWKKLFGT